MSLTPLRWYANRPKPLTYLAMPVSIIIQHQEDWPGNPGWWRYSRPQHRLLPEAPPIKGYTRWWYGNLAEAERAAAEWDKTYAPRRQVSAPVS